MSLVILTKSPASNFSDLLLQIKSIIKHILGQKRGPYAVVDSLICGLEELNYEYKLNVKSEDIKKDDVVYITGSVEALRWAIKAKKERKIVKLIVGPVMSVLPSDHDSVMLSKEIDVILFPSQWTKDHWLSLNRELEYKIKIWPAGVGLPALLKNKKEDVLIYHKNSPNDLLDFIKYFFKNNNIKYELIKYGHYKHRSFFSLLKKAKAMIYLSESESQGLAMFEAWSFGVPTFVWNRGYWKSGGHQWRDAKISSPYLTEDCGMFFSNEDDFIERFKMFMNNIDTFEPREYIANNFTNKKIAKNFLKIINN